MVIVVTLFFSIHPYFEPTNDSNEAEFILAFDKNDNPTLENFNGDLQQYFTKIANEKYQGDESFLASHMFLKLVNHSRLNLIINMYITV